MTKATTNLLNRANEALQQHRKEVMDREGAIRGAERLERMRREEEAIELATSISAIASLGHDGEWIHGEEVANGDFTILTDATNSALKVGIGRRTGEVILFNPHETGRASLSFTNLISFGAALEVFEREERSRKQKAAKRGTLKLPRLNMSRNPENNPDS
jgi:hypothetical protein